MIYLAEGFIPFGKIFIYLIRLQIPYLQLTNVNTQCIARSAS
jgi:hypothetical protein